jgi:hypothetical protein
MGPQTVRERSAKDLGRQIAALNPAEGTLRGDPPVWNREDGGGDVFAALFAADREVAALGCWQVEHGSSIGEDKAKIIHKN